MSETLSINYRKAIQYELNRVRVYDAGIDGDWGPKTNTAFRLAAALYENAGRFTLGSTGWNVERRSVAVQQVLMDERGIEVGLIDGLVGAQTRFAREALEHLYVTGRELLIDRPDEKQHDDDDEAIPPGHWPRESGAAAFFGKPGENHAVLTLPFPMRLSWDLDQIVRRVTVNAKCQEVFGNVWEGTLAHYGIDAIEDLRLDRFSGCFNPRKKRGGSSLSIHAYAAAWDVDDTNNQLRWGKDRAQMARPEYEAFWKIVESQGLVSLGRSRNFDWMHFQAVRL